ncbi:MAG TPA: hypothetical protein VLM85_00010 [Polyangiaceae bacterium]|nr:hypothetical protein [Polyangiaceae bacterium]
MRKLFFPLVILVVSCSSGSGVNSNDQAKQAYLGLDESIDKAITLGFKGFNAASSANIPTEQTTGDISGTMTITGQVDQGVSANKQMRLLEQLDNYSDTDAGIVYATSTDAGTDGAPAALGMSLQGIPTGTLTGSLDGTYGMKGALQGTVTLAVTFNGDLQQGDAGVERKPGTTHITGTATSGSGVYNIDVTR